MIVIHLEVNENIMNKKTLWKKKFYVYCKATCFSYYDCVPSKATAHIGNVLVFNSESKFNPHIYLIRNAVLGLNRTDCDK